MGTYLSTLYADEQRFTEITIDLLKNPKVDPSDCNNDAIKYASARGYLDIVKILMRDPRVDASAQNNFAVRWASANGHQDVVQVSSQTSQSSDPVRNFLKTIESSPLGLVS